MQLLYIDIPYLYKQNKFGMDFIYSLAETKKHDTTLFGLKTVQIIIDQHFRYWRWKFIYIMGVPMVL